MRNTKSFCQARDILKTADATSMVGYFNQHRLNPQRAAELAFRELDQQDNVFVEHCRELALKEAQDSSERYNLNKPLSALDGVPISVKDNFDVSGHATSNGSRALVSSCASRDSAVVERLRELGMVVIGKTTMSELAFSGLGVNPQCGTPAVVSDNSLIPGGSSSGAAASVALGVCPLAIGSDTSGSIRVPAAIQGIYGYRPSANLHDLRGCTPLSQSLDTLGIMARSVVDCSTLSQLLLKEAAPSVQQVQEISGIKLIVPEHEVVESLSPEVEEIFKKTLENLVQQGAKIEYKRVKAFDRVTELFHKYGTLVAHEAYQNYSQLLGRSGDEQLQEFTKLRLSSAGLLNPENAELLRNERKSLIVDLQQELQKCLLAYPTLPISTPKSALVCASVESMEKYNALLLKNTMIGSFLDTPSISMPVKNNKTCPGFGLMLSAASGRDEALLRGAQKVSDILS